MYISDKMDRQQKKKECGTRTPSSVWFGDKVLPQSQPKKCEFLSQELCAHHVIPIPIKTNTKHTNRENEISPPKAKDMVGFRTKSKTYISLKRCTSIETETEGHYLIQDSTSCNRNEGGPAENASQLWWNCRLSPYHQQAGQLPSWSSIWRLAGDDGSGGVG